MLAQKNRFHGHASLKYVYRNGRVSRGHLFMVRAIENPRRKDTRCSVVVSKKVLKSAVGRNRIRRRVYHILHEQLTRFVGSQDIVVVVCSAEVAFLAHEELYTQLVQQLQEVEVLSPPLAHS